MKCLSLIQPWTSLVISGAKRIETRTWATDYRGRIAIHASKKWNKQLQEMCYQEPFATALGVEDPPHIPNDKSDTLEFPLGVILGTVEMVDCLPVERLNPSTTEKAFGDYSAGRFGWILEGPVAFAVSIPCRGTLGLWEVPADLLAAFDRLANTLDCLDSFRQSAQRNLF